MVAGEEDDEDVGLPEIVQLEGRVRCVGQVEVRSLGAERQGEGVFF